MIITAFTEPGLLISTSSAFCFPELISNSLTNLLPCPMLRFLYLIPHSVVNISNFLGYCREYDLNGQEHPLWCARFFDWILVLDGLEQQSQMQFHKILLVWVWPFIKLLYCPEIFYWLSSTYYFIYLFV